MKALIYILCFLVYVVIQVILMNNGITLGGLPTGILFFVTGMAAHYLSKAWERKREQKKTSEESEENT